MEKNTFDVIIVGAGISGINAAYRLQQTLPDYSYAILDGKSRLGGTWDQFKYPGIRSDSDLFTFGLPWEPWQHDRAIAEGKDILSYLECAATKYEIDMHFKFGHMVLSMDWSSSNQLWKLEVTVGGERRYLHARHVLLGTGYYDYKRGLNTAIEGIEKFQGTVVHPQFWPEDLNYVDKRVVVIGSGATAVTLLPSMADKVKSITMLQRSPGYFVRIPIVDPLVTLIKRWLPLKWANPMIRMMYFTRAIIFYNFCRMFPERMINFLRKNTERQLPEHLPYDPHFKPKYNPWEQRMCICPGGDFFDCLRSGKAHVVTDTINTVTESGIKLDSGAELDADIIVTATGLKVQFGGAIKLSVDGTPVNVPDKFIWRGIMLQDVPNLAFVFGYTNQSWTLGADAAAQLWVRLLKRAHSRGMNSAIPRVDAKDGVREKFIMDLLSSSYAKAAKEANVLPKGGDRGPWLPRRLWLKDILHAKYGDISTGLQLVRI
ncbi:uncharacterized protein A1O9_06163 [Exophiala aquamarina CBS 119918]|uniref:FAD-containing monooxygenase EthA n=1 Tax=Exophiala aquamarina CBS 119918 TaxID=1182545 RepID=A0A072PEQ2_9EURO|nr:uncharacterized protein A1O9_06163 [Exophiala aquamarina CBS 119918]KEF58237.1 hypothetical protein A1O9_06163 [Exophiala aquamarina CBS 119918]